MPPNKKPAASDLLRARAEGRTYTADQLNERAKELEGKLAQLRNRYEQFFLGLDRRSPAKDREAMHKELDGLRQVSTPNTALKFKLTTLFNRLLSYERMWLRTEKDIEEGRYTRDLFKAKLHAKARSGTLPSEDVDTDFDETEEASAVAPPKPKPAPGPDETRLRAIYDTMVRAKRECREPLDGFTYEQMSERIKSQLPALLKQTGGKPVDFKVVIKDGKATLRAIAKP